MLLNVIDLEATCWEDKSAKNPPSEVIQIGIVTLDTQDNSITPAWSIMVKPRFSTELSPFCKQLTGLTDEQVYEQGVPFAEAVGVLQEKFGLRKREWASWGAYDARQLAKECEYSGISPWEISQQHLNLKPMFKVLGFRRGGLDKAMEDAGLTMEGRHHDGGDDAYNTARLLVHAVLKPWGRTREIKKILGST